MSSERNFIFSQRLVLSLTKEMSHPTGLQPQMQQRLQQNSGSKWNSLPYGWYHTFLRRPDAKCFVVFLSVKIIYGFAYIQLGTYITNTGTERGRIKIILGHWWAVFPCWLTRDCSFFPCCPVSMLVFAFTSKCHCAKRQHHKAATFSTPTPKRVQPISTNYFGCQFEFS